MSSYPRLLLGCQASVKASARHASDGRERASVGGPGLTLLGSCLSVVHTGRVRARLIWLSKRIARPGAGRWQRLEAKDLRLHSIQS
jgi:hypothetical protein